MPLQTGQTLVNRYRIVRLLGQGGFGAVYRAWDTNLKRPCAVKENLDTSPEARRQFGREATVLANLSHPNLPRVTDHFSIPDQGQYLVMDYVEGEDLATMMQEKGTLPLEQALNWIRQVAEALDYLHSRTPPVVHRDIKPANIRITPEGKAMLVDFGLVKLYDPNMQTTLGARAVTPGFAPPEQYGRGKTDERSDIYALGATLYTLLTGQEPLESVQRLAGRGLPTVFELNPGIPVHISQAIEKAMHMEPGNRFQSALEFVSALQPPEKTMLVEPGVSAQGSTVAVGAPAAPAAPEIAFPGDKAPSASKKKSRLVLSIGITILVLVCIIGIGAVAAYTINEQQRSDKATSDAQFQATLQEKVRLTQTAQYQATEEAIIEATKAARATATAAVFARMTATSEAQLAFISNLKNSGQLAFGPINGDLPHDPESGLISEEMTGLDILDFILEVRFFNPFSASEGSWDYGIGFRHTGKNDQYRLLVTSDATWELMDVTGDPNVSPIAEGEVPSLIINSGGSNFFLLVCQGNRGWFYVNDVLVAEFDLSSRMVSGDIFIGTGFYKGNQQTGETTVFRDFAVWALP